MDLLVQGDGIQLTSRTEKERKLLEALSTRGAIYPIPTVLSDPTTYRLVVRTVPKGSET